MAGAMTNWLEEQLLNAVFRHIPYDSPETVHVALHTADPTDGDIGPEVAVGGYTRMPATFSPPTQINDIATIKNSSDILFPKATADWGLITHITVRDSPTPGANDHALYQGALANPKTIEQTDIMVFLAGDLQLGLE